MKYGILKMAVVIGLVVSSSLAVAEGKFAYKQPLRGVDANPTFGMTQSEKQAWQEEQETIAMCLNESIKTGTKYNRDATNKSYVSIMSFKYGSTQYWYLDNETLYYRKRHHLQDDVTGSLNGLVRGTQMESTSSVRLGITYTTRIYEITYDIKTENYDWCVANRYPTAN